MTNKSINDIAVLGESEATVQRMTMGPPKAILSELNITDALHFTSSPATSQATNCATWVWAGGRARQESGSGSAYRY